MDFTFTTRSVLSYMDFTGSGLNGFYVSSTVGKYSTSADRSGRLEQAHTTRSLRSAWIVSGLDFTLFWLEWILLVAGVDFTWIWILLASAELDFTFGVRTRSELQLPRLGLYISGPSTAYR